jgi:hypothetical protein
MVIYTDSDHIAITIKETILMQKTFCEFVHKQKYTARNKYRMMKETKKKKFMKKGFLKKKQ